VAEMLGLAIYYCAADLPTVERVREGWPLKDN
jgi:hypothetical protein